MANMTAGVSFVLLAALSVLLFVVLRNHVQTIWTAPTHWRIGTIVGGVTAGLLGFAVTVALLGPLGVPAAFAASVLGIELVVALTLYHLAVQGVYTRWVQRSLMQNPSLEEKTFFRRIVNTFLGRR